MLYLIGGHDVGLHMGVAPCQVAEVASLVGSFAANGTAHQLHIFAQPCSKDPAPVQPLLHASGATIMQDVELQLQA